MIKVYGSNTCPGTLNLLRVLTQNGIMPEFVNVTGSVTLLKEFIMLRDTLPMYDAIRGTGRIGFPLIMLEDGSYTLDANSVLEKFGINERINYGK